MPDLLDLQLGAKAPSTVRKYRSGWLRWRTWALSKTGVTVIPAEPVHIALFLTELCNSAKSKDLGFSSLVGVVYSIAWVHKLGGYSNLPTEHPLVKGTLEGAKRSLSKPLKPKEPLSLELIQDIASHYSLNTSLAVIRFLFILLVGYAGFLRASEILSLNVADINIYSDHMFISILKRKNDQYREGHKTPLIRSNKVTCPVAITEKLLALLPRENNQSPLVRRIVKSKSKERFHESLGVCYTTIKNDFKKYLRPFIADVDSFGLHSFKS